MTKKEIIEKIRELKRSNFDKLYDNIHNDFIYDCLNGGYMKIKAKIQLIAYYNTLVYYVEHI